MRLVDADKLHLKLLDMEFPIQDQDVILDAMDDCTVDSAPVVHERWIDFTGLLFESNKCSACGGLASNTGNMKYCPNCGAKMDLPEGGE